MPTLQERKRRGEEVLKRYRPKTTPDLYTCASDLIADILLFVAQNEDEGMQILQSAEMDFRGGCEGERCLNEG